MTEQSQAFAPLAGFQHTLLPARIRADFLFRLYNPPRTSFSEQSGLNVVEVCVLYDILITTDALWVWLTLP